MQPRRRTVLTISALLAVAALTAFGFRRHLESAAETSAEAAADAARGVLLKHDDRELEDAFAATRAALAESSEITLYHVGNSFDEDYAALAGRPQVSGYPIRRKTTLARRDAAPLVTLLTTRSTYFPAGEGWTCMFEPHHVLRLVSRRQTVTAIICIQCGDVEFVIGNDSIGTRSVLPDRNEQLSRILRTDRSGASARLSANGAT